MKLDVEKRNAELRRLRSGISATAETIAFHDESLILIPEDPVSWVLLFQNITTLVLYCH